MHNKCPIGIFDSGYGGLTILKDIREKLPEYDYLYLGDNARAPYGNRSYQTVYEYTLECVNWFFSRGCELIILACNTASAKALRTIQQNNLSTFGVEKRVLGVIRPTSEVIGNYSKTKTIGILGTTGTVSSNSYIIEINKFFPDITIFQEACPMWVPLIENNEYDNEGADFFIKKNVHALLNKSKGIDTILLACTHYPLLINKLRSIVSQNVRIVSQGPIVADALCDYLIKHPVLESKISKNKEVQFFTTDSVSEFNSNSMKFFESSVNAFHVDI